MLVAPRRLAFQTFVSRPWIRRAPASPAFHGVEYRNSYQTKPAREYVFAVSSLNCLSLGLGGNFYCLLQLRIALASGLLSFLFLPNFLLFSNHTTRPRTLCADMSSANCLCLEHQLSYMQYLLILLPSHPVTLSVFLSFSY
ncbi:hypothetical protein DFH11DRAFT_1165983 [Phellopilus nigrolimitatus]|nr:hypothetical protein DFH11DRAFT_1165983 [Phellopilus nigrolimitatus]